MFIDGQQIIIPQKITSKYNKAGESIACHKINYFIMSIKLYIVIEIMMIAIIINQYK